MVVIQKNLILNKKLKIKHMTSITVSDLVLIVFLAILWFLIDPNLLFALAVIHGDCWLSLSLVSEDYLGQLILQWVSCDVVVDSLISSHSLWLSLCKLHKVFTGEVLETFSCELNLVEGCWHETVKQQSCKVLSVGSLGQGIFNDAWYKVSLDLDICDWANCWDNFS